MTTINTVEELKAAYPNLSAEIAEIAATAERERIHAIENIALAGFESIISRAKFEAPATAENVAMQIVAEQKKQGGEYLKNVAADVNSSGVGDVEPENKEGGAESATNPYDAAIDNILPKNDKGGN
ncbi:MAG: hypothetical protein FWC70_10000 [Defluviitaleaceae bacterium]|nr:hypothetical protein [Defluviitaleaceae bacterium]